MKWIFAWNDAAIENYGDLIRVAVQSARENTSLEMHCLHDGVSSTFSRWLEEQGVEIHPARFRFAAQFEEIARKRGDQGIHRIANGTFLRLEIPSLSQTWNWNDEWVFYTDIDVMFLRDPVPLLEPLRPRFFAAAPELWLDKPLHMNAGVMLLNLPALRAVETRFLSFVERHLETSIASSWDQGVLRAYFDPLHRAAWNARVPDRVFYKLFTRAPFSTFQWETLAPELNWKPYWGSNDDAVIVHFHGAKPAHLARMKTDAEVREYFRVRGLYSDNSPPWGELWQQQFGRLEPLVGT